MTSVTDKQSFGQGGALFAHTVDTKTYTGQFCMIHVITTAKFKTFTWTGLNVTAETGGDPIHHANSGSAHSFPAGTIIYGQISSFTLHTGAVMAYYAMPS
jgi:hypothetical protein